MNLWGPPVSLLLPGWRRAVRGRTWPSWRPHSQPDHVLVTSVVRVIDGAVVRTGNSDHLAVRAHLAW
jgi:endonuclease/exonuclease/phosphatase family metal-dependent hydrolase